MLDKKNPTAVQIGLRIKQVRKMAGYDTAIQLLEKYLAGVQVGWEITKQVSLCPLPMI